jgi:hypothetical protein
VQRLVTVQRSIVRGAVLAWFAAMVVVGASLLAKHVAALPVPTKSAALSKSLAELRPRGSHDWLAVHVMYAECRCSQRIVEHLVTTRRPAGWREVVLWVGKAEPSAELARRFDVRKLRPNDLARLGIDAAPLLVALDPNDGVRYVGGYTERKQGPAIEDLRLLADARRSSVTSSLPVLGCAVSERLKQALSVLPGP